MKKIYDEVLGCDVFVQELITPDIAEEHPHDMKLEELQIEEDEIDDDD